MIAPVVDTLRDSASLEEAVGRLLHRDPQLAKLAARHGPPPLWVRRPGFPTLVRIILEQQVSLASARAAFERLRRATGRITPRAFLRLSDRRLERIGFSRQKSAYCRSLAAAAVERRLVLSRLATLDDDAVRRELTRHNGIGPWTAEVYLLMALRRPDAWPAGDLALAKAAQRVFELDARPGPEELTRLAEPWRPWRAVAARLLWQEYLSWGTS